MLWVPPGFAHGFLTLANDTDLLYKCTAPYAPTGSDEIAVAAVSALGDRGAVLLGLHGVLALGESPGRALDAAVIVERQAHLAWLLRGVTRSAG